MKRLKKLIACSAIFALCLGMTACGNKQDEVVATVNGEAIYKSEYDTLYNEYLSYFGGGDDATEYLNSQKQLLIDELVTTKLLFQKANELGITCTSEEVDEAYKNIEDMYGTDTVNKMLEQSNMTVDQYKEMVKEQLILAKLQDVMIEGDTNVTDEDIKAYYDQHRDEYTVGAGADMKHVLVRVPEGADEATVTAAEETTEQIKEALDNGLTFEELYKKASAEGVDTDKYVAEDLGYVQYDEPNFDPLFLAGVKDVKEGQVSDPIQSSFGYHFVKVTGIKGETVLALDDVKDSIRETLVSDAEYQLYSNCLQNWLDESEIVTYEDRI